MIISYTDKFIFVKTRKVGGTSLEYELAKTLQPTDIHTGFSNKLLPHIPKINLSSSKIKTHSGYVDIKKSYQEEWDNFFKFTIERNPWDKVVSYFSYYSKLKPHHTKRGFKIWLNKNIHRLSDWDLYAYNNEIVVDYIIKYEDLQKELDTLNIQGKIPRLDLSDTGLYSNFRKDTTYHDMYDDEDKCLVEETFQREIDLLGYTF